MHRAGRVRSRSRCALRPHTQRQQLRGELPIKALFFDCLRFDAQSIADRPTRERFQALGQAVPAALQIPRLVTSCEATARAFL